MPSLLGFSQKCNILEVNYKRMGRETSSGGCTKFSMEKQLYLTNSDINYIVSMLLNI